MAAKKKMTSKVKAVAAKRNVKSRAISNFGAKSRSSGSIAPGGGGGGR
jgi:hypothetical protein